ncbi:Cytochrome P450 [Quillaja saponaria]|uniref:Cytochrome P450 n=1 Tax=Quillaja saponaria TaxID=32244 RepID=A0AAD7LY97_QUISA|nr:Cytochrome P450 [Quillaja saponaria]
MTLKHQIAPRVSPFFVKMVQKYGKVSLSWIGTTPRLIVGDAELMRLILINKNSHFVKPPRNPLVSLLQLGILTLEGGKWATRRKLILHAFQLEKLKAMVRAAFSISCCSLIERWQKLIGHQESLELDVVPEFEFLAGDVISRTAFGSSYQEGKKIIELQKEQAVLAVEANNSIYIPGLRFIPTKKNKRRYHLYNEIKQLLRDMIHKKEQAMKMDELGSDDLLSLLLQCKEKGDNGLTVDDIIEECKLFYFAGQETTANLLTWAMIVLSMHPNWQEKARDEVLRICGKVTPDFEAIKQLKIVNMVLQEVLRLYPPFPGLLRYTACETSLGGISIPAGVDIYLPVLLVHGDSNIWGEDAEEFNPERFSEGVSKASKDQAAFYPFGWGPRICLGQNFAMIEAKMALAMVLQHFSFELSPSYAHAPCSELTVCPQHGAPIMLHRL